MFGTVTLPNPRETDGITVDLASQEYGGALVASSDGFFSSAQTLNRPDRARTMGEGWETRRQRDSGNDFAVFNLAFRGQVRQLIVDTSHFKYNASAAVAVYGCDQEPVPSVESSAWVPLLNRTVLQPDTRHVFSVGQDQPVGERFESTPLSRWWFVEVEGYRSRGLRSTPESRTSVVQLLAGQAGSGLLPRRRRCNCTCCSRGSPKASNRRWAL